MKKIVALFCAVVMLMGCFNVATAEMSIMASQNIQSYACGISFSGTTVKGTARVSSMDVADKLGISSIKIQVRRDGSWVTVKTGTASSSTNTVSHSISTPLSYSGIAGSKYRCVAVVYVTDNGSTETRTAYSPEKTL